MQRVETRLERSIPGRCVLRAAEAGSKLRRCLNRQESCRIANLDGSTRRTGTASPDPRAAAFCAGATPQRDFPLHSQARVRNPHGVVRMAASWHRRESSTGFPRWDLALRRRQAPTWRQSSWTCRSTPSIHWTSARATGQPSPSPSASRTMPGPAQREEREECPCPRLADRAVRRSRSRQSFWRPRALSPR